MTMFMEASSSVYDLTRSIGANLSRIGTWIVTESNTDDDRGRAYVEELRQIHEDYKELTGSYGIDAYLGVDVQDVLQADPELRLAIEQNKGNIRKITEAIIGYIDTWTPAIQQYNSGNALNFANLEINKFRKILLLFEPLVYQE